MTDRRERFERIYDVNYGSVLGYALRRTDTAEDAHDVVSDTFLAAWRRLDDVPGGDRARLWLYGTARKVLANHYRSRRRQHRLSVRLQSDLPRITEAVAPVHPGGDIRAIAAAFARLRDTDRELLLLVGWEELDTSQLAEVLGCTATAARVRLHRARRRFASQLAQEGVKHPGASGHESPRRATARPDVEEAP